MPIAGWFKRLGCMALAAVLLLVMTVPQARAQAGAPVKAGAGKTVKGGSGIRQGLWQTFDIADGLPAPVILSLQQDRQGNLWLGTDGGGVCRYDGEEFTTFTTRDGLAHEVVWSMLEDRAGNLWFGTGDPWSGTGGGVCRYDGKEFVTFATAEGLADSVVLSIMEDRQGNLWFGTNKGVSRYDGKTFATFTVAEGLADSVVLSIMEDRQGNLWFGTNKGVSRYDGRKFESFTTENGLANNEVLSMIQDREGQLWFGTRGGVSRYDGEEFASFTTANGLIYNEVRAMLEDRNGRLWFGTEGGGVCRYDGKRFVPFTAEDGLAHNAVTSMLEDRDGNLWFGTEGGVNQYAGTWFTTYMAAEGLKADRTYCILEDRQGDLWFGTWEGGVSRYDGKAFVTFTTRDGLADDRVWSMLEDRRGKLWFGTGAGVSRYDGKAFVTFTTADGLAYNWVRSMLEDREGNLWFGTGDPWSGLGGGVSRFDGKEFVTFTAEDGLAHNDVRVILQDRDGALWFGTGAGVSRYDGKHFVTFNTAKGLAHDKVLSMLQDHQGNLWIGTGGGVSRYNGKQFVTFTTENGLAHNWVTSILEDQEGVLWFATGGGGVSRYDGFVFQNLNKRDGLVHNKVWKLLEDRKGDVWMASEGGITRFHPHHTPPSIRITGVIGNHPYGAVEKLYLPSSQRLLTFEFRSGIETRPGQTAYVYRLAGYEKDWRVTREHQAQYRDLAPGAYTFAVKAVDHDLTYSQMQATVAVEVFYQPQPSPVHLAELQLGDLFASFYPSYTDHPVGAVQVINDSPDSVQATLSFYLPDYMRRPSEHPLVLAPQSSQRVELTAYLEGEMLSVQEAIPVKAEVSVAVASGEQTAPVKETRELTLYGRGALRWDDVRRAAAFVTPDDPAVAGFGRPLLMGFDQEIKSLGRSCQNLLAAMVLFEALRQHGVRYVADANLPYAKARMEASAIDHIQYPAEVLARKSGDCDDLTALYCSLLENAGVPTALVDYPGHLFMLFDAGLSWEEAYKLPVEDKLYVIRGDQVWVPVEMTKVGAGFAAAWRVGAEEVLQIAAQEFRERAVDTAVAWEEYTAVSPPFAGDISPPGREVLLEEVEQQRAAAGKLIDRHIERQYLDPLKVNPDDRALWLELIRTYVRLGRYEVATKSATNRLLDLGGQDAGLLNQLGNIYYLKGEIEQAALFYSQAAGLAPEDAKILGNLERALAALGKSEGGKVRPPVETPGLEALKEGEVGVDADSFYWKE